MASTMDRIESNNWGITLEGVGKKIIRYGLVAVLLWIGALKFTAYEAEGIQGLVANSPLMSWGYSVMTVRGFAALIGIIEITLGILIALRPIAPKLSAIRGRLAHIEDGLTRQMAGMNLIAHRLPPFLGRGDDRREPRGTVV